MIENECIYIVEAPACPPGIWGGEPPPGAGTQDCPYIVGNLFKEAIDIAVASSFYKNRMNTKNRRWAYSCLTALLICGYLTLSGCVHVSPQQQRLVSKANMQFSGSVVFSYQDRLLSQFESGSASFIGGQSGDCGSCSSGGGR